MAKGEKDVAAHYSTQGDFGKIAARAAYAHRIFEIIRDDRYDQFSSSASWLHDSGINVTVVYAMQLWDVAAKEDPVTIFVIQGLE